MVMATNWNKLAYGKSSEQSYLWNCIKKLRKKARNVPYRRLRFSGEYGDSGDKSLDSDQV